MKNKKVIIYIILIILAIIISGFLIWNNYKFSSNFEIEEENIETPSIISASYYDNGIMVYADFNIVNDTVTFTHPELGTITLPLAISASGSRYANEDESIVFWEHQEELSLFKDGVEIFRGNIKKVSENITEEEAKVIAKENCLKEGEKLLDGFYNENTKTWWFDVILNEEKKGCNPACVVNEETKTAEINWRCTGIVIPENNLCGIENCHGLDIVCGSNIAEMCTREYRLGDKCRQFAECGILNGVCQQIENLKFNECKSCVQKCERDFEGNSIEMFNCESRCGE